MKDGQHSISKALYLFDSIKYGLVLKDSQIDQLEPEEIGNWDLDGEQFKAFEEWLTEKDKNKDKPKQKPEEDNETEVEIPDTDFGHGTNTLKITNIPDIWDSVLPRLDY